MKKAKKSPSFILLYALFTLIFVAISALFIMIVASLKENRPTINQSTSPPVVIIDAGHGGEDGGAVGVNGCYEKNINLEIAKKLESILTEKGIKCVLTRETDILLYDRNQDYEGRKKHLDMLARLEIVTSYENAIFVSIHQNSFPQEKYSGFQTYYSANNESSYSLAKTIEEEVRNNLQPDNKRKAKMSAGNIYLLDKLSCPAVLLECGFLSNRDECGLLCTEEYQNRLSDVIATSIEEFLNNKQQSP